MEEQDLRLVSRALNSILKAVCVRICDTLSLQFDFKRLELDQRYLKDLKNVVKSNSSVIPTLVNRLFDNLRKMDCDRRLGALLVADYFFHRSHQFRLDLIEHLRDFFIFTLETDPLHYALPEPLDAAKLLKKEALKRVKGWVEKFGRAYWQLGSAEQFLKKSKYLDFNNADAQLLVERQRAEEERFRQSVKAKKVGDRIRKLLSENREDIVRTLTECQNSINLIFPDEFKADDKMTDEQRNKNDVERLHGYKGVKSIEVVVNTAINIEENEDNADLVTALKDAAILLGKAENVLKRWLQKLSEVGGAENEGLTRELVDLKSSISQELKRCEQLKIKHRRTENDSDDEDDDDFEDVVKEGLELDFKPPDDDVPEDVLKMIERMEEGPRIKTEEPQPGPSGWKPESSSVNEKEMTSPDLDNKKKADIPCVQYGLDLKYWGEEVRPAAVDRNLFDGHRFWKADDLATESEEIYKARQMTYIGEARIAKHPCHAPLGNGKLCPRMDLERCPFHGPIVERDEFGFPLSELGKTSIEALRNIEQRIKRKIEKDEKEYIEDVEAAVGVPLSLDKEGRKKRRMGPNRTYGTARKREKTEHDQARERLSKKLFDPRAMRRVANVLADIQKQKAQRQFAHQFNYAVTNRR